MNKFVNNSMDLAAPLSLFTRFFGRFFARFTRRKKWQGAYKILRQTDLFILPNRYGLYIAFLILAGFAMGYKVQNNFIMLGVIFLFLLFTFSLIAAVRNLQGFKITISMDKRYFAHQTQFITIHLQRPRAGFNITLSGPLSQHRIDISNGSAYMRLPIACHGRGVYHIGRIKLQTSFPFGIVRCWTWLAPPQKLYIYPQPNERPISQYPSQILQFSRNQNSKMKNQIDTDSLKDPRPFVDGDLPSRIDWKRFATTRETLIRDFGRPHRSELLLEAPAKMPKEAALSYLCGGLLVCERAQCAAYMRLEGRDYPLHNGTEREIALHALACI
ncbi:MAG: hypothetical protein OXU76_02945 [Alphaproteobacteria bacterium]|nr:hypothetical protein [Alphaproteobacteria bacterium]